MQYISDIHLGFDLNWRLPVSDNEQDRILLVAGDMGEVAFTSILQAMEAWLADVSSRFKKVLFVAGNHEYYQNNIERTENELRELAEKTNTIYLNRDVIEIDDVRIVGCTLWTNFNSNDPLAAFDAQIKMNDFSMIDSMTAEKWLELYQQDFDFLVENVQEGDVVMTHHAPSLQSCPARYNGDPLNYAFASNLDRFVAEKKPQLWVHGHIHDRCFYTIDETTVVCNPKGYGEIQNPIRICEVAAK